MAGETLQISVGDAALPTRYLNHSTAGQSGSTVTTLAPMGMLYRNTADTEILITVSTAAVTPAAGTVDVYLQGYIGS